MWGKEIVYSTYDVVCAFSGISLLPFVLQNVEKRGNSGKIVTSAILTVSGILLLILFILPSVLGWGRIQKELYPVLPLMAGADLPGNVLARFDVLWIGFLLYGLFFCTGKLFPLRNPYTGYGASEKRKILVSHSNLCVFFCQNR